MCRYSLLATWQASAWWTPARACWAAGWRCCRRQSPQHSLASHSRPRSSPPSRESAAVHLLLVLSSMSAFIVVGRLVRVSVQPQECRDNCTNSASGITLLYQEFGLVVCAGSTVMQVPCGWLHILPRGQQQCLRCWVACPSWRSLWSWHVRRGSRWPMCCTMPRSADELGAAHLWMQHTVGLQADPLFAPILPRHW
jgi:hypothetical protein